MPAAEPTATALRDQLLLAAFAEADTAHEAWLTAAPTFVLDDLPFELHGLFPVIGERLRKFGVTSADLTRYDGMRKRLWSRNAVRTRAVGRAVGTLAAAGIAPTLTGGAAVLAYNGNWGLRALAEVDLVVEPEQSEQAIAALTKAGWCVVLRRRDGFLLDMQARLLEADGEQLTIRWSTSSSPVRWPQGVSNGRDSDIAADVGGHKVRLAPRFEVLAFIATDALGLPGYPATRRFGDALMLLTADPPLTAGDWDAFVERIVARNGVPEALEFVGYLAGPLQAAIPTAVLTRLAAHTGATTPLPRVARQSATAAAFARRQRTASRAQAMRRLPGYLVEVWDLERRSQLPRGVVVRGGRVAVRMARQAVSRLPSRRHLGFKQRAQPR